MKNPFAYNIDDTIEFKSYFDQREPHRAEVCETVYNHSIEEAFFNNIDAPSPNIAHVDGYKPLSEINNAEDVEDEETADESE